MPSVNLDLVRSIYAAWEGGDFGSADWACPEIEFAFADGPEPGRWTGLEQMSGRYGDWLRGWKDFRAVPEEYFVVDENRILVFVINSGRGRTSGVEFEQRSVANFFDPVRPGAAFYPTGAACLDRTARNDPNHLAACGP